jgi:hypothetical protein
MHPEITKLLINLQALALFLSKPAPQPDSQQDHSNPSAGSSAGSSADPSAGPSAGSASAAKPSWAEIATTNDWNIVQPKAKPKPKIQEEVVLSQGKREKMYQEAIARAKRPSTVKTEKGKEMFEFTLREWLLAHASFERTHKKLFNASTPPETLAFHKLFIWKVQKALDDTLLLECHVDREVLLWWLSQVRHSEYFDEAIKFYKKKGMFYEEEHKALERPTMSDYFEGVISNMKRKE